MKAPPKVNKQIYMQRRACAIWFGILGIGALVYYMALIVPFVTGLFYIFFVCHRTWKGGSKAQKRVGTGAPGLPSFN